MDENDVVLLSGGVSVGDHDQIKPALKQLGIEPDLWRVKVKPGKPFLFATRHGPQASHLFGLPGNPVSSFVTFLLFVRPALLKMMGAADSLIRPRLIPTTAGKTLENPGDRPHYLRGTLVNGQFMPFGMQQSHALLSLSRSEALLRLEAGQTLQAVAGLNGCAGFAAIHSARPFSWNTFSSSPAVSSMNSAAFKASRPTPSAICTPCWPMARIISWNVLQLRKTPRTNSSSPTPSFITRVVT
jgi:hypothetical protein